MSDTQSSDGTDVEIFLQQKKNKSNLLEFKMELLTNKNCRTPTNKNVTSPNKRMSPRVSDSKLNAKNVCPKSPVIELFESNTNGFKKKKSNAKEIV